MNTHRDRIATTWATLLLAALLSGALGAGGCAKVGAGGGQAAGAEDWYRREGLFKAFDPAARDLSLNNAYLLELASYVTDRGSFEIDRTLGAWGFDQRRDFTDIKTSTHGFVASNDRMILVAFAGTDTLNLRDLISDADALQPVYDERYCPDPAARVHPGFRDSVNSVIDGVRGEVTKQAAAGGKKRALWLTGHSRGGAMAVLAAAALAKTTGAPRIAGVYTFGQPRVGNAAFVGALDRQAVPVFRFVNRNDPVPAVPPESRGALPGYKHGGTAVYLAPDGRIVKNPTLPAYPSAESLKSVADHYQTAYHTAIYQALANPNLIEDPQWRRTAPAGNQLSLLPRP